MHAEPDLKTDLKTASTKQPEIGSLVADRYRIMDVIGRGGMGVVYKALQVHMSKVVALKMLLQDGTVAEQDFLRFKQEARAASALNHPHIVAIHDFDVLGENQAYLAMDFLDGINLSRTIHDQGAIGIERFESIFTQACEALQHAHDHGVIHRDIKPSNLVLIERDGIQDYVMLVDFGLVKLLSETDIKLTSTNTLVGSPLYMSPEQCRGYVVDHRTDIYSLGCVMYEAITGVPPVAGSTALDTIYKHISEPPKPMHVVNPNVVVPAALERVIFKALSKHPEDRQSSMTELRDELRHALGRQAGGAYAASALGFGPAASPVGARLASPVQAYPPKRKRSGLPPSVMPVLFVSLISAVIIGSLLIVVKRLSENDLRLKAELRRDAQQRLQMETPPPAEQPKPKPTPPPAVPKRDNIIERERSLLNKGNAQFDAHHWAAAQKLFEECLGLEQQIYRSQPELTLPLLAKLAICSFKDDKPEAARGYVETFQPLYLEHRDAMANRESLLRDMGTVARAQDNAPLFDALLTDQIQARETRMGFTDADAYQLRIQLAKVKHHMGRTAECKEMVREILEQPSLPVDIRAEAQGLMIGMNLPGPRNGEYIQRFRQRWRDHGWQH